MGLACQTTARSAVEVSLSPAYHFQFSSISKATAGLFDPRAYGVDEDGRATKSLSDLASERLKLEKKILAIKLPYFPNLSGKYYLLNTDKSPLFRPHSDCLKDRGYVYKPNNKVAGNKPVEVGRAFSTIGLSARGSTHREHQAPWNLPVSMRLVPWDANTNTFTAQQVTDLIENKELPFHNTLTVNALDSNYAAPEYIAKTSKLPNLVSIIRFASNRNVWKKLSPEEQEERRESNDSNKGADAIYGKMYKLSEVSAWELSPDQYLNFDITMKNAKKCIVKIRVWDDMMIRTKRKINMKDKACRLVCIQLFDVETGEPIFKRKLWLNVWGKRRAELNLEDIYESYRNRFDIEHFFRFGKQKLLLDSFQTPDEHQLQNWLEIVSLAYWLLWIAEEEASEKVSKKWQIYDKKTKRRQELGLKKSPSQVQNQLLGIILGFEQAPFLPNLQIKGKGRKEGAELPKRQRHPVRKKPQKQTKVPC